MTHEIEADAAKAGRVEPLELRVADRQGNERDAGVRAPARRDRILGHRVVEAVRRRLHDDAALDAELRVQREQPLLRCLAGREAALPREWESLLRPENVHVRVAGLGRQREPWTAGPNLVRGLNEKPYFAVPLNAACSAAMSNLTILSMASQARLTFAWSGSAIILSQTLGTICQDRP